MGEFELIRRYFLSMAPADGDDELVLGPGDDCAIQRVPAGRDLVFSVDTLVEGCHFPPGYSPESVAWRALGSAASDLAAMGARPVCFTLALTLPDASDRWLAPFARGLAEAGDTFGLALAGGDTTCGPLTVTVQVHGTVPQGQALRRRGAVAGDVIAVSGTLGDAAAALDYLTEPAPSVEAARLLARYHRPEPRFELGEALIGVATAAIDISDGLCADLGHILDASGVGATVDARRVPLSPALRRCCGASALVKALYGGDDYELCVTIPAGRWRTLPESVKGGLTAIGEVDASPGLRLLHAPGEAAGAGYDHFRSADD